MDDFPAIQSPPPKQQDERTRTTVPPVPPVPLAGRRKIKQRHPFDIYADQLDTLKELSVDDRKQGGVGSMSAMVREALDDFIAKKRV